MFNVPQLSGMVHGASSHQEAVWVEAQTHNLHLVTFESVHHLPIVGVPNFGCLVERPSHYQVSKGVVKCHSVDHILVLLETEKLSSRLSVPHFASPIIGSRNELVSCLIEGAVGQRQQVGAKNFKQLKLLLLVFHLLLDQF